MKYTDENDVKDYPEIDNRFFNESLYRIRRCSPTVFFNMVLQIHITDFCNLKCRHCYGESENLCEMSREDFCKTIDQYFNFLSSHHLAGMVNITGGEPLIHKDFSFFLAYLYENYFIKGYPFKITLLTNGTILSKSILDLLKRYQDMIFEIQISIDGTEKEHDSIRGIGTWNESIHSIQTLLSQNFRVSISFVVSKFNYKSAIDVLKLGETLGVYRVTISRLVPLGKNALENKIQVLPLDEFQKFQHMVYEYASTMVEKIKSGESHTYLAMQRCDLWHLADIPYILKQAFVSETPSYLMLGCSCKVGNNLMVVMPNLDVLACRRLPMVLGNLNNTSLQQIWTHSPILAEFRQRSRNMKGKCATCKFYNTKEYKNICSGGGPCMAVALGKSIYDPDPLCWLDPEKI